MTAHKPTETKLRRRIAIGLAIGIFLSLLIGLQNLRSLRREASDAQWASHIFAIRTALRATGAAAVDVETGARGFALVGDDWILEPYNLGRQSVEKNMELLRQLTADDPAGRRKVDALAQEVGAAIQAADAMIDERRRTGTGAGEAQLRTSKKALDFVRATLQSMLEQETRLLDQRSVKSMRIRRSARLFTVLSVLLGVGFYGLAWIAASRALNAKARAQERVDRLLASLEQRVAETTAAHASLETESAERSAIEAQLRASEEQMRLLLDGIADYAICMLDVAGNVISWNAGAAKLTGYSAEEILGKPFASFHLPEDQKAGKPRRELEIAASEGRFEEEGKRIRKSGEIFWVNVIVAAMYDQEGSLRGFSKVVRDITRQKESEAALKKQSALLDLAHDAIVARDMEGQVVFWNRGAEALYGWTAQEAQGRVTHDLLRTKFPSSLEATHTALIDTGEWEGELRHTTRAGIEVPVASRWSLQRDPSGVPTGILEINRDITDRKKAEQELRTLASIVQNSRDFIGLCTPDMQPIFVNRSGMEMVGLDTEDQVRKTRMLDYFWPADREQIEAVAVPVLMRDGNWSGEVRFRHFKTGDPIHTLWDAFVIRDEAGQVVAWATISPNLERLRLLQAALREKDVLLRESQARQAGIIDSAMDAIMTVDAEQRIVVFNAAAEKMFLCTAAEALGQSVTRFIPPRFRAWHGAHMRSFGETNLTNRAMGSMGAISAMRSNGEEFPIEASISQVNAGGQRLFTVIIRDATQRQAAEREVRRLNEELEARVAARTEELRTSNAELESFTYAVAHDLRAPLRQMAGFCAILLEEFASGLAPEAQAYLQRVQRAATKMGFLVDELLKLGKLGRQSVRRETVDLNRAIEEVVSLLEPEFAGRKVQWSIAELPPVTCDAMLIRLVFQNLLSNALKYSRTRSQARIEIGQLNEPGSPTFFVRDNGVGFDMKYADKLFGVFQRLHREQDFEGTGVGLATVHRIITKHGGRIWANAQLDSGAAFFFTLDGAGSSQPETDSIAMAIS